MTFFGFIKARERPKKKEGRGKKNIWTKKTQAKPRGKNHKIEEGETRGGPGTETKKKQGTKKK